MINENRLIEEFIKLTAIDAESGEEAEMRAFLTGVLAKLDISAEPDDAGNLFARLPGTCAGDALLFSAHMDTVSPGVGKKAVLQPDGRIISDGTTVLGADDAAGLAAILEALAVIRERGLPHPEIEVLFPAAEEPYCRGTSVFDFSRAKAKTAYVLDLTGPIGTAAVRAPSILSLEITVRGRAAHAGFAPEEGINALTAAARALAALPTGHVAGDTTVNFGVIRSGTGKNIVPESASLLGEIRSLRHEAALAEAEKVREVFCREAEALGAAAEVNVIEEIRAYSVGEDEYVVRRLAAAMERLDMGAPTLVTTFGGSDNNNFAANGVRGVVLACAMFDVHTVHEYTTVSELVKSAELVTELMTMEDTP